MPSEELVSVIIPTVRRRRRLWQALISVCRQTYSQVEVIVINDGGEPLEEIIGHFENMCSDCPIRYVPLPSNHGLAHARNIGISNASGSIIALLDDDDQFRPTHLSRLVHILQTQQPQTVLVYDDVLIQVESGTEDDPDPRIIATCKFGLPYDEKMFNQDDYIVPSSTVFWRHAFEAVGGFDENLPLCEDWDFLLRLRERGHLQYVGGEIGVEYSVRPTAGDNLGSTLNATRRAVLDALSARYGLPPLSPKTFLDVARDLCFSIAPMS